MRKSGKEMNVIRHNDVATNGDIMLPGLSRKNAKRVVISSRAKSLWRLYVLNVMK